jgi:sugar/nucleoside kinase (ribokinase family)
VLARKVAALIIGELCLDVHAAVPIENDSLAPLVKGADVSTQGDIAVLPGGTAWLFADALASSTTILPLIAATVGGDWAGNMLLRSLSGRGFPAQGVVRAPDDRTDVVATANFNGRARFMAWPRSKVNRKVHAWEWPRAAELVASHDVRFAWISGYLFDDLDPSLFEHVRILFANLREMRIPVVMDLVPHDFARRVGTLERLEREYGPVDVLVGEFCTMVNLGFGELPAPGRDTEHNIIRCAQNAAVGRVGAVAQHRITDGLYMQAIASQAAGECVISKPVPASGPRGLGDNLAVEALQALGLADRC